MKVEGIGRKKFTAISGALVGMKEMQETLVFLKSHGITTGIARIVSEDVSVLFLLGYAIYKRSLTAVNTSSTVISFIHSINPLPVRLQTFK